MTIGCRWAWGLLAGAIALTVTGCTTVMSGAAVRDPGVTPGAVDPALLNAANYPTHARPPLGAAGDSTIGALVEARRMADYMTGPWEVDPALLTPILFGEAPAATPLMSDGTGLILSRGSSQAEALGRLGLINGYVTGREVTGQRLLTNAVLRFADPAAAAAAAAELIHANPRPDFLPPAAPPVPCPIPGHPAAQGASQTIDAADHQRWTTVQAFTPHGPFVLFQQADLIGSVDDAARLVGKTLDLQGPLIDTFVPTDLTQFAALPRDPSGMLAMALPPPGDTDAVATNMTVGPRGMLNLLSNPTKTGKVYADAGVDASVQAAGWLHRARDAAGAAALLADDVKSLREDGSVADAVPNLAGSACQKSTDKYSGDSAFTCVAARGRYEFSVYGHVLKDVQQQAAAQYLILAAA